MHAIDSCYVVLAALLQHIGQLNHSTVTNVFVYMSDMAKRLMNYDPPSPYQASQVEDGELFHMSSMHLGINNLVFFVPFV